MRDAVAANADRLFGDVFRGDGALAGVDFASGFDARVQVSTGLCGWRTLRLAVRQRGWQG